MGVFLTHSSCLHFSCEVEDKQSKEGNIADEDKCKLPLMTAKTPHLTAVMQSTHT